MKFVHSFSILVLLYIIGDVLSTVLFLSNGGLEMNPLYFQVGFVGIVVLKVLILAGLLGLRKALLNNDLEKWWNTTYTVIYGLTVFVVFSNIILYFTGLNLLQHINLMWLCVQLCFRPIYPTFTAQV